MAEGAPVAAVPAVPSGSGNEPPIGTGQAAPKAPPPVRHRVDLGDGEQEYDLQHLVSLAQRGRKTAQIMSKAEQRAQEAVKLRDEADARLARLKSKDLKERRAALKELGMDEVELARAVAQEHLETEALTPEQRRIRELEQRLQSEEAAKRTQEEEGKQKHTEAEVQKHTEEFSNLFLEVTQKAGLPRESASAVFYRLANMYQAADAAGHDVDPDIAAETIRAALQKEHTALYRNQDGTLNVDAFEASLSPEDWKAINKRAVEKYRARRTGGAQPVTPPQPQQAEPEPQAKPRGNFWKELDRKMR